MNPPSRAGEATPGYYMLRVFNDAGMPSLARIVRIGVADPLATPGAPTLASPGPQAGALGVAQSLQRVASAANAASLVYSATGMPPGLRLDALSGLITGTPSAPGSYDVVVSASDRVNSSSAGFVWAVNGATALSLTLAATPGATLAGSAASFAAAASGLGVAHSWTFGDGSAATPWSSLSSITKVYDQPGTYAVTLNVRDQSGATVSHNFIQTVYLGHGTKLPAVSTNVLYETPHFGRPRLWVVNADNDSITGFDTITHAHRGEVSVGAGPRAIAAAGNDLLWLTNKHDASLSIVDPAARSVVRTLMLPRASQPFGLAIAPTAPQTFVVLEASGELLRFDTSSFTQTGRLALGPSVRHVSMAGDGSAVYVSRFITPPLPGEGTAALAMPVERGGEVLEVDAAAMTLTRTIVLAPSSRPDAGNQGSGVPNYLGPVSISPDGTQAYVPGKQDNIGRGQMRNGAALDFQNTVRAVSSRVVLAGPGAGSEDQPRRIDHDNAGLASAAAYDQRGVLLFVALETSREVAVLYAHSGAQLTRFDVGRAPQGLALSADGYTLYVNNFIDRTVGVFDLRPLLTEGLSLVKPLATLQAVATERLAPQVLQGKQLFYDARDPRLERDRYLSCATCHQDGGHDGRVWDMTQAGEGLRNTINLRGRAGAQGRLHWSGNFDEVQDFEGQIRSLAGGTGLLSDAQFTAGTRSQPLGEPKARLSAELDALAAYVGSLNAVAPSPWRQADSSLSAEAAAGRLVVADRCASCHAGSAFSDSGDAVLHDVGTHNLASGQRLGLQLAGIDTPTLRDAWATAPYLHNGSAATLAQAITAHRGLSLNAADLTNVVAYTQQIGGEQASAPASTANLVLRAKATLLDKIGALYEVRVNGSVVGAGQLDAQAWVDLFFDVARLVANTVVEVVFKNDAASASEDRNLAVQSITLNAAATLAAAGPGVVIAPGAGAQAFNGVGVLPAASTGGWLPWDAALRLTVPDLGGASEVTVRGAASLAGGVGAQMELRINGVLVGGRMVTSPVVADIVFATPSVMAGDRIDLVFTNDLMLNGKDRNLFIESVTVRGVLIPATAAGVVIDPGAGAQAFDDVGVIAAATYGGWVPWNGALRLVAR